jgi:hypothetical protein
MAEMNIASLLQASELHELDEVSSMMPKSDMWLSQTEIFGTTFWKDYCTNIILFLAVYHIVLASLYNMI